MGKTMVPSGRRKKLGFPPPLWIFVETAGEFMVTKSLRGPFGISSLLLVVLLLVLVLVEVEVEVEVETVEVNVEEEEEEEEVSPLSEEMLSPPPPLPPLPPLPPMPPPSSPKSKSMNLAK